MLAPVTSPVWDMYAVGGDRLTSASCWHPSPPPRQGVNTLPCCPRRSAGFLLAPLTSPLVGEG